MRSPRFCRGAFFAIACSAVLAADAPNPALRPLPLWMTAPELQVFNDHRRAITQRMMAASRADARETNPYDLAKLGTREAIMRRRDQVREYREAWQAWTEEIRDTEGKIRDELKRRGVGPERTAEILESYRRTQALGAKARADLTDGPQMENYFELLDEFLDLAERSPGAWRVDASGRVVITNEKFRLQFRDFGERLRASLEAEEKARAAAIDVRAEAARAGLKAKAAAAPESLPSPAEAGKPKR